MTVRTAAADQSSAFAVVTLLLKRSGVDVTSGISSG